MAAKSTVMDTDVDGAENALRQHREGIPVEDAWYAHMLKEHDKGSHRAIKMRTCPACAKE